MMNKYLKLMIVFSSLIFITLFFSGCNQSNSTPSAESLASVEPTTLSNSLIREQSVYFNCIAAEGLSSYSLTKVLYEQPEIKKNFVFEYSIYTEGGLIEEVLEKGEASVAILPFRMAVDTLIKSDNYKMVGVVKANSHVLLGISELEEVIGKEIRIYDASGFNGQFLTSVERLEYELDQIGLEVNKDYRISYANDRETLTEPSDDQVLMIEEGCLEWEIFSNVDTYLVLDESDDYQLIVLMEQSMVEIYPEIVISFVEEYYKACLWLSAYPDRAIAYASQLTSSAELLPARSLYYFDALKSKDAIKAMLTTFGYDENVVDRIEEMIVDSN